MKERSTKETVQLILGIILLIALVIGGIFVLKYIAIGLKHGILWLVDVAERLDAIVIVAIISATVSITSLVLVKVYEYRQATKRYLYNKREEPYTRFIEMVYKMQKSIKNEGKYTSEEMIDDITKFSKELTLWGSNRVVKKWLKFRTSSQQGKATPKENLFILEGIIFEIRKDMGQRGGLRKGDILRFFVNDI